jgi:uncharacterized protein (TIGR03435 family)
MTKWLCILLLAPMLANTVCQAQQLAYDVVTIKPNTSGTDNSSTSMGDSTFEAENTGLKRLLVRAYGVRQELIFGIPGWAESARFDINAKVVDPDMAKLKTLTIEQRREFILALLKDRFHLEAHIEMKTLPVYELLLAGGAPKFHASPTVPSGAGEMNSNSGSGQTRLIAKGIELSSMAAFLTNQSDRPVIDRTGLKGRYNIELTWTDDRGPSPDNGSSEAERPGLFTALKEQLGLKLQPGKGLVPTLVVDRLEQPTKN